MTAGRILTSLPAKGFGIKRKKATPIGLSYLPIKNKFEVWKRREPVRNKFLSSQKFFTTLAQLFYLLIKQASAFQFPYKKQAVAFLASTKKVKTRKMRVKLFLNMGSEPEIYCPKSF